MWNIDKGAVFKEVSETAPVGIVPGASAKLKRDSVWALPPEQSKSAVGVSDVSSFEFPSMPCMPSDDQRHRDHLESTSFSSAKLFNAMVSRPVGRAEIESNPDAKAAI